MVISPDNSRIRVAGVCGNLFMALMCDANGNQLWANTSNSIYAAGDVAFGPGNISYFAAGTYFPQDPNPYRMAIVKFDAAGNLLWSQRYDGGKNNDETPSMLALDAFGAVYVTGKGGPNHYRQTGLPDLLPTPPTNLSGLASYTGSNYEVRLSFSDNATNEFWVEAERCAGSGWASIAAMRTRHG